MHLVTAWDVACNAALQHLPQTIPAEAHTHCVIRLMHMTDFVDRVNCEQHLHDNDGDNSPPMRMTTLNTVLLMQTCLSSGRKSLAAMISLFSCLMTRSQSMPFWLACRARAHRRSRHAAFTTFARPTSSTRPNVCACGQLTRQVTSGSHCTSPACKPACKPSREGFTATFVVVFICDGGGGGGVGQVWVGAQAIADLYCHANTCIANV